MPAGLPGVGPLTSGGIGGKDVAPIGGGGAAAEEEGDAALLVTSG